MGAPWKGGKRVQDSGRNLTNDTSDRRRGHQKDALQNLSGRRERKPLNQREFGLCLKFFQSRQNTILKQFSQSAFGTAWAHLGALTPPGAGETRGS